MIYFDIAPAYGVMSGIVQVELGARVLIPHQDDFGRRQIRFLRQAAVQCHRRSSSPERPGRFTKNAGAAATQSGRCVEAKLRRS